MMLTEFITHTNEVVTGERLQNALNKIADGWINLAHVIRKSNEYAPHVSEATKDRRMNEMIEQAERIRNGTEPMTFALWQLIDTELTGKCVSLLPK